jgi:NAD(P)-dependent dehydrogenase (short-subunit alcohol dehydrogenase family)
MVNAKEYIADLFEVSGKTVALTGGGGILCGTMARALGKAGARVAVLDNRLEAARSVADDIVGEGGIAAPVEVNALDRGSLERAHGEVTAALGPVDVLVNGVGGNRKDATTSEELSFFDIPEEGIRKVFDANFMSAFFTSQVFARAMGSRGKGNIINISSMGAFQPLPKVPGYSAGKAAISNFTAWLAVHMAKTYSPDIRVNAIAPGFFLTDLNRYLLIDERSGELTARGKAILAGTPAGRFGSPDELIGALFWLISDASKFVTGSVVIIDGGFNAYSGI